MDEYATPPEGFPVWCVEQEVTTEFVLQGVAEILVLAIVFFTLTTIFRSIKRNKARKKWRTEQLNKSENNPPVWHH